MAVSTEHYRGDLEFHWCYCVTHETQHWAHRSHRPTAFTDCWILL